MPTIKKLTFAPFFLIFASLSFFLAGKILHNNAILFSFNIGELLNIVYLLSAITLMSFFYVLFVTLAIDWKIVAPVAILGSILGISFLPLPQSLIAVTLSLSLLLISFYFLNIKLKTYINFEPLDLLATPIKNLSRGFFLIITIMFFLSINAHIQQNGFQIPESVFDIALRFTPQAQITQSANPLEQLPISKEQIALLKQNPGLLKQFGLDPKILESIDQKPNTQNLVKQTLNSQIQEMIKPFLAYLPATLAIIFYLTLASIGGLIFIFLSPLIWLIFSILESTKFIRFTKEMREVKKLVV